MITKMKKLISISTIPVLALSLLLVLGTVMADDAKKPAPSLRCTIEYVWDVSNVCWLGTIDGDIEGVILWPPVADPPLVDSLPVSEVLNYYSYCLDHLVTITPSSGDQWRVLSLALPVFTAPFRRVRFCSSGSKTRSAVPIWNANGA